MSQSLALRKRIPRGPIQVDGRASACWALRDLPSMLILKAGEPLCWRAACDKTWMLAPGDLPDHVHISLKIEQGLKHQTFATRHELLEAVHNLWLLEITQA